MFHSCLWFRDFRFKEIPKGCSNSCVFCQQRRDCTQNAQFSKRQEQISFRCPISLPQNAYLVSYAHRSRPPRKLFAIFTHLLPCTAAPPSADTDDGQVQLVLKVPGSIAEALPVSDMPIALYARTAESGVATVGRERELAGEFPSQATADMTAEAQRMPFSVILDGALGHDRLAPIYSWQKRSGT